METLPEAIRRHIEGKPYRADDIGCSKASVLLFDHMVLKIAKSDSNKERKILTWLEGKLPAPRLIAFEQQNGFNYLLMSKIPGEMACSEKNMQNPEPAIRALADGLKALWAVDTTGCPNSNTLEVTLASARFNLENVLIDPKEIDEDRICTNGFRDMNDLFSFLDHNRPDEEIVFSHNDYCLPNVFLENGVFSGLVDLGDAGIGDKWQDIALCVRSLEYNLVRLSKHSCSEYERYKALLFDELGFAEDEDIIKYYILLDNFFYVYNRT
ncbi:MAG TPA: aminoglycoside 3'-phosphotransferase [Oscillospiraceae bacterium]|nr:aminoglycoside 3'-phosphotransferase [Oscillospiraceae bacterium]HPF55787.1 aminoglycoside 3'-phosphotransferase [Clostridiales bacterium]HPK35349.1 aminoglycoside 3'-phosphotransferase [Oscillospiraceae bacterium]HPR74635.1 aminoglycoside 3'-phosphotransferase [Oscillospiraceae bacterium]